MITSQKNPCYPRTYGNSCNFQSEVGDGAKVRQITRITWGSRSPQISYKYKYLDQATNIISDPKKKYE